MDNLKFIAAFCVTLLFACAALGVATYVPASQIRSSFGTVLGTFTTATSATLAVAGALAVLGLLAGAGYMVATGWQRWQRSRLALDEYRVVIARQNVIFESAPAGSLVFRHDVLQNVTDPIYLEPGRLNGEELPASDERRARWAAYQLLHSTARAGRGVEQLPPPEVPTITGPALDLILRAERRLISGASGSGKTSLAKHIVWQEWRRGVPTIPIDPHHEGESLLGFPVLGAGRNYDQVERAIEALYLCMDVRYKQAATGWHFSQFDTWHIIIDELTALQENCSSETIEYLKLLIIESRKVKIRLTLSGHSHNVADLGLSGPIRNSLSIWSCTGGNGEPVGPVERLRAEGSRLKPDGQFIHPGPFDGGPIEQALIVDLPDSRVLRAQVMADAGESLTSIAREFFGVDKPNGRQIAEIKDLLTRAAALRQAHDGRGDE